MGLFNFLESNDKSKKSNNIFSVNVDGIGLNNRKNDKSTISANIDGIGFDTKGSNQSGFSANIDGVGFDTYGKSRSVRANVDGVSVGSQGGNKGYVFVDGVKVQTLVDKSIRKHTTAKLKEKLGLHKDFNYKSALANLYTLFTQLKSGAKLSIKDAWKTFSGQPSETKYPSTFGQFMSNWARSKMNPIKYLYKLFTERNKFDIESELRKQLQYGKFEIFQAEKIVREIIQDRVNNADSVELDQRLGRRIKSATDMQNGLSRFEQIFKDRMKNVAQDVVSASKQFGNITRTQQKAIINNFKDRMRSEIRKTVLGGFIFGAGGLQRLTSGHLNSLSRVLDEQYKFLDGFVADLYAFGEQGKEINANQVERAGSYANVLRQAYYTSYQQKAIDTYGSAFYERRSLSPAENCFSQNTLITTDKGNKFIQDIKVGDKVLTRNGYKPILKTHTAQSSLWLVSNSDSLFATTKHHPFFTGNDFVEVKDLKNTDRLQHISNFHFGNLFCPNANNFISTFFQVFVLSVISILLFYLPFCKWIERFVTVPIFTVNLNDDIWQNQEIHNKFRFNSVLKFKRNFQLIKKFAHFYFRLTRILFKHSLMSLSQSCAVNMSLAFNHFNNGFGIKHRIISLHTVAKFFFSDFFANTFIERKFKFATLVRDNALRQTKIFSAKVKSVQWIEHFKKIFFVFSPFVKTRLLTAFNTDIRVVGFEATASTNSSLFSRLAVVANLNNRFTRLVTMDTRAFKWSSIDNAVFSVKAKFTQFKRFVFRLFATVIAVEPYSFSIHTIASPFIHTVYNITVGESQEYFANGYLVHNCPDCIDYAEQGCQPSGTLPLPTVASACMNNCKCEFMVFDSKDMCEQSMESFATDGEE